MKNYIFKNIFLLTVLMIFIISLVVVKTEYILYTNFIFYCIITIYIIYKKNISLHDWKNSFKEKRFWTYCLLTIVLLVMMYSFTSFLENMFTNLKSGMNNLRVDNLPESIIFGLSTMFLAPIAEEVFFRQCLIDFRNNKWLIVTSIFSIILYALEHSITPWGIFLASFWGLGFTIPYVISKNIYTTMTAHLIVNIIINGFTFYALFTAYIN